MGEARAFDLAGACPPAGYHDVEVLRDDGDCLLARAVADADARAVVLKMPRAAAPPRVVVRRLEREWQLAERLDGPWAVRPLGLARADGRVALVLPAGDWEPLERLAIGPLPPARFLPLALGMAEAVAAAHAHGVIHKDLNPRTILVAPATGAVRLTGFGLASLLPFEPQEPVGPAALEGTLAYMSPEQTGRTSRALDARTDLYSLGVVFYRLLTGDLPFHGVDAMDWVHAHLARQPRPPAELAPAVPHALSELTLKLLAKSADERYQTAAGLAADLRACLAAFEEGAPLPASLGTHDVSERFALPQRLYGREREAARLVAAFERMADTGLPALVVIAGAAGVGKTALVGELYLPVVRARGFVLAGKFDQYQRDIPYSTIAAAFAGHVAQLLAESPARVAAWRARLQDAVGLNGQLVVDLVPRLALVLGPQPPVVPLPAAEAERRFQLVFRQFVAALAGPDRPLVLFLDDLQWADPASLALLRHALAHPEARHVLVIGAYRDHEVGPAHPLRATLAEVREAGVEVREIALAPLGADDVRRFVADAMRTSPAAAAPLARLVGQKTGGNPYFMIQFLAMLHDEHLVAFDRAAGAWRWDLARIEAERFTDNVVDHMVGRLRRLPAASRRALAVAACLGNAHDLATLALALEATEPEAVGWLEPAMALGVLAIRGDVYKFLHDRVQQAAYSFIPVAERPAAHLRIARLLVAHLAPEALEACLFEVVNHFGLGLAHVTEPGERAQVAELARRAGHRARGSAAYVAAGRYFGAGAALLPEAAWRERHELAWALGFGQAECTFLAGGFDEAERQLAALLPRAADDLERLAIHRVEVDLFTLKLELPRAVERGIAALRLVGIAVPPRPTWDEVCREYEAAWALVGDRPIASLAERPPMTDPRMCAALDVLAAMFAPAQSVDPNLSVLSYGIMARLTLAHGASDADAVAFVSFGMALGPVFGRYEDGYRFGRLAWDLVERRGLAAYKAKIAFFFGDLVGYWTRHLRENQAFLRTAFEAAVATGDITIACYCCNHLVTNRLLLGDPLDEVWQEAEGRLAFTRGVPFDASGQVIVGVGRVVRALQGHTRDLASFDEPGFDEAAYDRQMAGYPWMVVRLWYHIMRLMAGTFAGAWPAAVAAGEQARPILWCGLAHPQEPEFWFHHALALANDPASTGPERRAATMATLAQHLAKLAEWAAHGPENFAHKHALVAAEVARLAGDWPAAEAHYEAAIRSAGEHGYRQNEALACELAAGFYEARDLPRAAEGYMRQARDGYARWGAHAKVRQLERRHAHLAPRLAAGDAAGLGPGELDLAAIMKASQAISRELERPDLLRALMRNAIAQAGARWGCLLLVRDGELRIEAEARADEPGARLMIEAPERPDERLPMAIVNYVARTREAVVLDDAAAAPAFAADPYVARRRLRSVLCMPIMRMNELIGVIYLENDLAPGAFPRDRLRVLEVLAGQAAVSLENAQLYADLRQAALVVHNSPTVLVRWRLGPGYPVEYVSENVERAFGYPLRALLSGELPFMRLVHADDRARVEAELAAAMASDRMRATFEYRLVTRAGRVRWVEGITWFERDAAGRAHHAQAVLVDVTDRRDAAEERERLSLREQAARAEAEAARELERQRSAFANAISHDLRVPLTSIVGYAEFLEDEIGGPLAADQRTFVAQILAASRRLERLLDDMLEFARLEAGTFALRRAPADLGREVRQIAEGFRPQAEAARLTIAVEAPDGPLEASLDVERVARVVGNLITNAIKFTPPGGHITIALRRDGDQVRCEVRDTGVGIAADDVPRLFQPFAQLEAGRRARGGTGLGLHISKSIVEAHGGRIGVESLPGRGSTFWFTLPAS